MLEHFCGSLSNVGGHFKLSTIDGREKNFSRPCFILRNYSSANDYFKHLL